MTTIYLREKNTGNYETATKQNATHRFSTKKEFKDWFNQDTSIKGKHSLKTYRGRIIKATYGRSQTYFQSASEFLNA